jgi:hypothetical protein
VDEVVDEVDDEVDDEVCQPVYHARRRAATSLCIRARHGAETPSDIGSTDSRSSAAAVYRAVA